MQIANIPQKWTIPFANGDAGRVEVPPTTTDPTRASLTLGFPPLTRTPPASGGVPPQGEDFNGAMNQVARIAWWKMAGGAFPYDATFATDTNINGYPQGAVVASADLLGAWASTVDNNTANPDVSGANWAPVYAYGTLALTGQTGGTNTLTPAQAMKRTVTVAGALTSNLVIVVPAWQYDWNVTNNTTGAFTVTVKTATGSGQVIPQTGAPTAIAGDGTNVISGDTLRTDLASTASGKGAALVGYAAPGAGSANLTVYDKLGQFLSVIDKGADPTGVADSLAAFNAALAVADFVVVPPGTYKIGGTISLTGSKKLFGAARTACTLINTTANLPTISLAAGNDIQIRGIALDRSVAATAGGDGIYAGNITGQTSITDIFSRRNYHGVVLGPCDYNTFSNSICELNVGCGVLLTNAAVLGNLQWYLNNVLCQENGSHGFEYLTAGTASATSVGSMTNCATFANTGYGVLVAGISTNPIAAFRMLGGFFGQDGQGELYLDTYGGNHKVSSVYFELCGTSATGPSLGTPASHVGQNILLTANNNYATISDCEIVQASYNGVASSAKNLTIDNCRILSNGLAGTAGQTFGVYVSNTDAITKIHGCTISNATGSTSQTIGLVTTGDNVLVTGTDFTNNTTQPVYPTIPYVNSAFMANLPAAVASVHPQALNGFTSGGILVGNATGGNAGAGTINVSAGIFKNNTAYTNP